jgi:hypothetical protein
MSLLSKQDIKSFVTLDHDQLLSEQLALLEQINSLEQKEIRDDEITHSLSDLRQKYNQLMDEFHRRNDKPRYDPMERLPSELFRMVIYGLLRGLDYRTHEYLYDTNQALLLTLVSTQWRDFILGMSSIWTIIQVNSQLPDSLARAAICFTLSRDLPIRLNIFFPIGLWDSFLPIILENRHRMKSISLNYLWPSRPLKPSQIQVIIETLEQLLPLTSLQRISTLRLGIHGNIVLRWLLDHCSRLQAVTGLSVQEDMLHLDTVRELREITTRVSLETFVSVQRNMPMLTHVTIYSNLPHTKQITIPVITRHPNSEPLWWKDLTCSYPRLETLFFLMPRLTNLKGLTLMLQFYLLKPFLTQVYQLPQLLFLSLTLVMGDDKPDDTLLITDAQINDQVMSLQLTCSHALVPEHSVNNIPLYSNFIGENLAKVLPGLQEATLSVPASLGISKFYVGKGFPKLSKLELTFSLVDVVLDHCCESAPSLRNIRINSRSENWAHFSSMHATQMKLGHRTGGGLVAKNPSSQFDSSKWPALHMLSIDRRGLKGQSLQLPYLRELELWNERIRSPPHSESWLESEDIACFCKELAICPMLLPSLERLSLCDFAHWDILLLMIKRRNITASDGVLPLKYLTVKACYPKELTSPIVSLLRGNFPDWWSLYDVSNHGTLDLICDPSM